MADYILILVFYTSGVSVTTAQFNSKDSCILAGEQAIKIKNYGSVNYTCARK